MKFYEVRDVDGTSYTGASKLVGYYKNRAAAERVAARIFADDSWHSGYVIEHTMSMEEA
jgi:hypothetical protein